MHNEQAKYERGSVSMTVYFCDGPKSTAKMQNMTIRYKTISIVLSYFWLADR